MTEYRVLYTRARDGQWRASIRGMRRCRSRGRTLRQARVRLRKALARFVEEPFAIDFIEDVRLPGSTRRLVGRHWAARRRVQAAAARADAVTRQAIDALRALSLNHRDAGDLLGLAPQKLQKLWRRAG